MRHDFIDRYSRLRSPVHRLPAGAKAIAALAVVVATVSFPSSEFWWLIGATSLFLFVVAIVSTIPLLFIGKRLLLLEPFVAGVALLSLFHVGGVAHFVEVVARSSVCLLAMILLSNTTPFASLLEFLRSLHSPSLFVTVLALMYRYLFVLIDETERMQRARLSRTFTVSRPRTWIALAALAGQLFIRSSERAERIYAAMSARGWR